MAILILSKYSVQDIPYHLLLKESEEEKILFASSRLKGTFDYDQYEHVEFFDDYSDNPVVEWRAYEISEKYNVNYVITSNEFDVQRAARIREKLGIKGQDLVSANAFRDKVIMKEFASKGVMVPKNSRIEGVSDIFNFIKENGYPVIIKPVAGAGSRGVFIISSQDEMVGFLEKDYQEGYEIEQLIKGQIYTIDGYYHKGKIILNWCGRYINDCLSFREGKQSSNIQLQIDNPLIPRLEEFIQNLINTMPMPETTPFHCEVFHDENDNLVLCEIASRVGGAGIKDVGFLHSNFNVLHNWIKAQCGLIQIENEILTFSEKLYGWLQIPSRNGKILKVPKEIPFNWVKLYKLKVYEGQICRAASTSSLKIAVLVIEGTTEEELIGRMETLTDWYESQCIWEESFTVTN